MSKRSSIYPRLLSGSNAPTGVRVLLIALLLLVFALYLPAYAWAFIGDDYVQFGYIRELVEAPATFPQVFHPFWSTWYFRPLQNLWLLAIRLVFGLIALPYYYLQGLWHLLGGVLLFALARRLGLRRPIALAATALFLLNAHHQDVVGWVSSVATPMVLVFSLAALLAWTSRRLPPARQGVLIALFSLLALLSHESGILLPPFLLLLALGCPQRRPAHARWLLAALLGAALVLGAVHLLRPNLTLPVSETPAGAYLDAGGLASFLAVALGRWTLLTRGAWGTALLNGLLGSPVGLLLPLAFLLLISWLAYRFARSWLGGSGGHRPEVASALPLAWIALHLIFAYGALWVQAPELLAGRHLYGAWAGVALLSGLAVQTGLQRLGGGRSAPYAAAAMALLLIAFLSAQIYYGQVAEAGWLTHAREVAAVEAQMKQQIPAVGPETAIFARSFVITPAFAPYAAAAWYGETGLEGGSLARLRAAGKLGPDTYLFDYDGGDLRQLLPALHDYPSTVLLWPAEPAPVVDGPEGEERLALPATGDQWQAITITTTVPAGSSLYTAFAGPAGVRYRLRARAGGTTSLLAAGTVAAGITGWQDVLRSLPRYWTRETTFLLETEGNGAWAMPRLVIAE